MHLAQKTFCGGGCSTFDVDSSALFDPSPAKGCREKEVQIRHNLNLLQGGAISPT